MKGGGGNDKDFGRMAKSSTRRRGSRLGKRIGSSKGKRELPSKQGRERGRGGKEEALTDNENDDEREKRALVGQEAALLSACDCREELVIVLRQNASGEHNSC